MGYSTSQLEVRFRVREGESGTRITCWYRNVQRDDDGNPTGIVIFEALCGEGEEKPCKLVANYEPGEVGLLVQDYGCKDSDCGGECRLQYSENNQEYHDVTDSEPPPELNCYFRCMCAGQSG